jgi:hypothetical protein
MFVSITPFGSTFASAQIQTDYDTDGDGVPDRYDEYPYDRDNDGVPDDRDEYPDDPYNRPTETPTTNSTPADDSGDTSGGITDELCFINLWWLWVLIGSVMVYGDYKGFLTVWKKNVVLIGGIIMILTGLVMGGYI